MFILKWLEGKLPLIVAAFAVMVPWFGEYAQSMIPSKKENLVIAVGTWT